MPIPAFDHNNVLPPHIGNPADGSHLVSPYAATTTELVHRFATSEERINILIGLLNFRTKLNQLGLIQGFQWLDGSFVEDIEIQQKRPPNDLDIITMYWGHDIPFQQNLVQQLPDFADKVLSKKNYYLDHFGFDIGVHPETTIEISRYFIQLFTHNRNKVWKGMIRLELNTPAEDANALQLLQNLQTP